MAPAKMGSGGRKRSTRWFSWTKLRTKRVPKKTVPVDGAGDSCLEISEKLETAEVEKPASVRSMASRIQTVQRSTVSTELEKPASVQSTASQIQTIHQLKVTAEVENPASVQSTASRIQTIHQPKVTTEVEKPAIVQSTASQIQTIHQPKVTAEAEKPASVQSTASQRPKLTAVNKSATCHEPAVSVGRSLNSVSTSPKPKLATGSITSNSPPIAKKRDKREKKPFQKTAGQSDAVVGLSIVMVTLLIMIVCGRFCAILCTSAWLYFLSRSKKAAADIPDRVGKQSTMSEKTMIDFEDSKKKVVLNGFLERNHRHNK